MCVVYQQWLKKHLLIIYYLTIHTQVLDRIVLQDIPDEEDYPIGIGFLKETR